MWPLWEVPGLTLLATRKGGMWEADEHRGAHGDADADHGEGEHAEGNDDKGEHVGPDREAAEDHAHVETDMDVWPDPRNAKVRVPTI
jgi:ABC-type Zn2+ transport system substrate-binding protein/surface adhesin